MIRRSVIFLFWMVAVSSLQPLPSSSSKKLRLSAWLFSRSGRNNDLGEPEVLAKVDSWKKEYCSFPKQGLPEHFTGIYERGVTDDGGDWSFTEARNFYLTNLKQGLGELEESTIPKPLWGALAHEFRECLKAYTRYRNIFFFRFLTRSFLAGPERTLDDYEKRYHKEFEGRGYSQEDMQLEVSIAIFNKAKETRTGIDRLFQAIMFFELLCLGDKSEALLQLKQQAVSPFLLPETVDDGLLPVSTRKYFRDLYRWCAFRFDFANDRKPERWVWIGTREWWDWGSICP